MPQNPAPLIPEPASLARPTVRLLFLIGMMGSGKTTVGSLLANLLHVDFVDLDAQLERTCGSPVPVFFAGLIAQHGAIAGEAHFRRAEREVLLATVLSGNSAVVATGGGVVIDPANRATMREAGATVYLEVSAEELTRRLRAPEERAARPLLLASGDLHARIHSLLAERSAAYLACDLRASGEQEPQEVANAIATWLNRSSDAPSSL